MTVSNGAAGNATLRFISSICSKSTANTAQMIYLSSSEDRCYMLYYVFDVHCTPKNPWVLK